MSRGLVPLVLLPTVGALAFVGSAASTLTLLTILRLFYFRARNVSRQLSRKLSRTLSSDMLAKSWLAYARRHYSKIGASLITLKAFHSLSKRLRHFDVSIRMNSWDQEIDDDVKERLSSSQRPAWGKGVPIPPAPGEWRPYLHTYRSAGENLEELHGALGLLTRSPHEMTIDQIIEGVRRVLLFKFGELTKTEHYWNEGQARSIGLALARDIGLPEPLPKGGLDECVPFDPFTSVTHVSPKWFQTLQRFSLDSLRPFFHAALSWRSRFIETPFGKMHVLDTSVGVEDVTSYQRSPPVILQHGAFVTGWSMALLGWLLARQGRRVIIPDLFDFDHGYSSSDAERTDGLKVRRWHQHLEALSCVVQDLLRETDASGMQIAGEVDLIGHSLGGILVPHLAKLCEQKGLPIRKIVLLAPGGPLIKMNNAKMVRFVNSPWNTLASSLPNWVPFPPVKLLAKLLLPLFFGPNVMNSLFGLKYSEYFGNVDDFHTQKPVLLLWGTIDVICRPRTELASALRQHFPNLDGFWVEGGDHNIQIDSVTAIAREINTWLGPCAHRPRTSIASSLVDVLLRFTDRNLIKMSLGHEIKETTPLSRL